MNEDFIRRVLGATSGSSCQRAEGLLPDLVDGELAGMDRQLVQAHLEHCERCRHLAVTLTWAMSQLPALARIDPGPGFTEAVLDQTSRAPQVQVAAEPSPVPVALEPPRQIGARFNERALAWWRTQVWRPGFATEFAYAATVVLVLLTSVPGSPLRETPDRALRVVTAGVGSVPVIERAVGVGTGWLADQATSVASAGWSQVESRIDPVTSGWRDRVGYTTDDREQIAAQFKETVDMLKAGRLQEAGFTGKHLVESVRDFWRHWWSESQPNQGEKDE